MVRAPEDRLFERYLSRGDQRALAALFDRVAPQLWRVATYLTRGSTAVEDAVQATFLAAIEHAERWDRTQPFVPWLLGILVNQVRHQRERDTRVPDPGRLRLRRSRSPDELAQEHELTAQVRAAIFALRPPYRDVLDLFLLQGLTPQEIADRLALRPGTTRMRLQRGLARLRRVLPAAFAGGSASAAAPLLRARGEVLSHGAAARPATVGAAAETVPLLVALGLPAVVFVAMSAAAVTFWWPATLDFAGSGDTVAEAQQTSVDLEPGQQLATAAQRAESVAPPPGRIVVRVRNAETKRPVRRARVALGTASAPTLTDHEGLAGLEAPPGATEVRVDLWVRKAVARERVVVQSAQAHQVEIELPVTVRARVLVVDAAGEPVAGARVFEALRDDAPREPAPPVVLLGSTDAQGLISLAAVDQTAVFAELDGWVPTASESVRGEQVTLRLRRRAGNLCGCVRTAAGLPARDALLAIQPLDHSDEPPPPLWLRTDANGRFATRCAPLGACLVCAMYTESSGFRVRALQPAMQEVVVVEGGSEMDLQMQAGASLLGCVSPLPAGQHQAFEVHAGLDDPRLHRRLRALFVTTARPAVDGTYRFDDLLPGSYWCRAEGRTGHNEVVNGQVALSRSAPARWDPSFVTWSAVRLRCFDARDLPLACEVFADTRESTFGTKTGADGRVAFVIPPGTTCTVTLRELRPPHDVLGWFDAVTASETEQTLRLTGAHAPGSVSGRVLWSHGVPPDGTLVHLAIQRLDWTQRFRSTRPLDADGKFRFPVVPPGEYRLGVESGIARVGFAHSAPRTVGAGEHVEFAPWAVLARGIAELRFDTSVVSTPWVAVLQDGIFEPVPTEKTPAGLLASELPVGKQQLLVWADDIAPATVTVDVAPTAAAVVDVPIRAAPAVALPARRTQGVCVLRDAHGAEVMRIRLPHYGPWSARRGLTRGWTLHIQ